MTNPLYKVCPLCLEEMQRAVREIERLRAVLEIVTKDRDSLLTTFGSTPAQMADKLAKMRAPDEPRAVHPQGPYVEPSREQHDRLLAEAMGLSQRLSAVHADPTGKTREPPHCPSCSCGHDQATGMQFMWECDACKAFNPALMQICQVCKAPAVSRGAKHGE